MYLDIKTETVRESVAFCVNIKGKNTRKRVKRRTNNRPVFV